MILTEADLHAYNRGELSLEAAAQLEGDPLAVEDAARLRAIAEAVRDESEIRVVGRAEALARLQQAARPRIGVPAWVWATGLASVAGLVVISLPTSSPDTIRYRNASWSRDVESAVAPVRDLDEMVPLAPAPSVAQDQSRVAQPESRSAVGAAASVSKERGFRAQTARPSPNEEMKTELSSGRVPRTSSGLRQASDQVVSAPRSGSRSKPWLYALVSAPIWLAALVFAILRIRHR